MNHCWRPQRQLWKLRVETGSFLKELKLARAIYAMNMSFFMLTCWSTAWLGSSDKACERSTSLSDHELFPPVTLTLTHIKICPGIPEYKNHWKCYRWRKKSDLAWPGSTGVLYTYTLWHKEHCFEINGVVLCRVETIVVVENKLQQETSYCIHVFVMS